MVKRHVVYAAAFALACAAALSAQGPQTATHGDPMMQPDPPILGPHIARDVTPAKPPSGGSPDLLYHGGAILTTSQVTAIFWGTSWSDPVFVDDKIGGLDAFYGGAGGSHYMNTNTEYTGTNGQVTNTVTYTGHIVDTSAAPRRAPRTSAVLAEVCSRISNPVTNGYYIVYGDTPRGHAGYCAWHSYGTCNGVNIQFGWAFNLDGDAGCDPGDTSGLHSQGLAALANVSGHELSEAVTDPRNGGWYDSSGAENADKCAWTFDGLLTFSNGSSWLVQGNWSNAAYDNGQTGYAKGGCIVTK